MEKPTILFLRETKCSSEDLGNFGKRFWKGAKVMALDASGTIGGLGLLWKPNLVSITNFFASRYMISACFHVLGTSVKGVITIVYGPFQLERKTTFLEELRLLSAWVGRDHWIIGGYFNLIRSLDEKKGGTRSLSNVSVSFNEVIEELHLVDV